MAINDLRKSEVTTFVSEQQRLADHMLHQIIGESVPDDILMISEASGTTYYEVRQFLTLIFKNVKKPETMKVIDDLLKVLGKLEIMNKPAPTIKKLKSISPAIF